MNERIRELAKESGLIQYDTDGKIQEVEKFAELIVRECVAICQDIDGEEDAMARCGRQDCVAEIKEHFGVE